MLTPTPEEIAYMKAHIHDDNSGVALRVSTIMPALATLMVVARLVFRATHKVRISWDDFMIIFSLVLSWGLCVCAFYASYNGLGRHIITVKPLQLERYLKALFAFDLLYSVNVSAIKISILLFYRRIFATTKAIRVTIFTFGAIIVTWTVARVFSEFFQCRPISYFWNHHQKGSCINLYDLIMTMQVINIITDVMILIFPMPIVWKLQIPRRQKLALCGVFCAGAIACIASIIRAFHVKDVITANLTWSDVNPEVWSMVEVCVGIITACLPTIRTSLSAFARRAASHWSTHFSSSRSTLAPGKGSFSAWSKRSASTDESTDHQCPSCGHHCGTPAKPAAVWDKVRAGRKNEAGIKDVERRQGHDSFPVIHVQHGLEVKETYRHDV